MATGDQNDVVGRLKAVMVRGWFPTTTPGASSNTPVLDGVLAGIASMWAWLYSLLAYVKLQTRIGTATDVNLDIIAQDYFGPNLARLVNEGDTQYRARIRANLFAPKDTRAAVSAAVENVTGLAPFIFEPRNTGDTGGYGASGGPDNTGLAYGAAGGWGSLKLPFQAFIIAQRPSGGGIALVGGYYSIADGGPAPGGYGVGAIEYAGLSLVQGQVTDSTIYGAITSAKPAATIMWTAITDAIPTPQAPGQVTNLGLVGSTPTSVSISWSAPATGGAASMYWVFITPPGSSTASVATTTFGTTATVSGLTDDASYSLYVMAVNSAGPGPASNVIENFVPPLLREDLTPLLREDLSDYWRE